MRDDLSSTAQYHGMVTRLRDELAQADKKAAKLRTTLEQLLELYGDPKFVATAPAASTKPVATALPPQPLTPTVAASTVNVNLSGLGIGDACVAILRASGIPMRNREVLEALQANGFVINSDNPLNNVTSSLNHRLDAKGDIVKEGKSWVIKKGESLAEGEASHMNGAAVPPA